MYPMHASQSAMNVPRRRCLVACLAAAALSLGGNAWSQQPERGVAVDREYLVDFYQATGGENWHNNEGWLGEPGTECDWHGVECGNAEGTSYGLFLRGNGLTGEIPDSLGQATGLAFLELGGNALGGTWRLPEASYKWLSYAQLAHTDIAAVQIEPNAGRFLGLLNLYGASLASIPEGIDQLDGLAFLDLRFNKLAGRLPASLAQLELEELRLAGNQLTGSILPALEAMAMELDEPRPNDPDGGVLLDLRGNRFTGSLDEDVIEQARNVDGWINLCWNTIAPPDDAATAWLESEHVNAPFEECLDQPIRTPDPRLSGSWYDPDRPGEGFSIMLLEDGQTLVNWYTYPNEGSPQEQQAWLLGNQRLENPGLEPLEIDAPLGGRFSQGRLIPGNYTADMGGHVNLAWLQAGGLFTEQDIFSTSVNYQVQLNRRMTQLTSLAGSTCDNGNAYQQFSGAWYDPQRSGEGFIVEVLPDERVNVYWFTYQPGQSGHQAWMIGGGAFLGEGAGEDAISSYTDRAQVELVQPVGARFGEEFEPAAVEVRDWGSLELRFDGPDSGHIIWDSQVEGYGSGEYPIERLATPRLADCD
jgi:hypothetical protein